MHIDELDTPVPVVDLDIVEHNLAKMQAYCDAHGLALRPHIKTHKIPSFAHRQVELGAKGITCQKLGEAEVMIDAGLDDILISYPLVGATKADRLAALSRRAKLRVGVDSKLAVETVAAAARASNVPIGILVEFDSGNARTGVTSVDEALALAIQIGKTDVTVGAGRKSDPQPTEAARRRLRPLVTRARGVRPTQCGMAIWPGLRCARRPKSRALCRERRRPRGRNRPAG